MRGKTVVRLAILLIVFDQCIDHVHVFVVQDEVFGGGVTSDRIFKLVFGQIFDRIVNQIFRSLDETWRGEAEVEEPPVGAGLAGEAASPLAASSHCGVFQPQDESGQKELAVAQPEGARADGDVPLHLLRGATLLALCFQSCS
jgi:hypothetical protein